MKYSYYCDSDEEVKEVRSELIKQAIERQKQMNYQKYRVIALSFLSASVTTLLLLTKLPNNVQTMLPISMLMGALMSFTLFLKYLHMSQELIKYEKFLEIYPDIEMIKNWCHDLSLPPLDIETIDKYDNMYIDLIYDAYYKYMDKIKDLDDSQLELKKALYPRL